MYNYDQISKDMGQGRPDTPTGTTGKKNDCQYEQAGVRIDQQQQPPLVVVNSPQKKADKTGQALTRLKETFISKPGKPKSFIKKLFKSKEKSSNQTSSDGSIEIIEPQEKNKFDTQPVVGLGPQQSNTVPQSTGALYSNQNSASQPNQFGGQLSGNSLMPVDDDPFISNRYICLES